MRMGCLGSGEETESRERALKIEGGVQERGKTALIEKRGHFMESCKSQKEEPTLDLLVQ